jgi:cytochrome c oxidase subunit I+III
MRCRSSNRRSRGLARAADWGWPRKVGQGFVIIFGARTARYPLVAALLLAGSSAAIAYASRALKSARTHGHWPVRIALLAAIPLLIVALGIDLYSQWQTGLRPVENSYGAVVYTTIALQGFFVATVGVMGLYTLARSLCGLLNAERRATFDNTLLLWHYTVIQGLVGLAVVHVSPRLLG